MHIYIYIWFSGSTLVAFAGTVYNAIECLRTAQRGRGYGGIYIYIDKRSRQESEYRSSIVCFIRVLIRPSLIVLVVLKLSYKIQLRLTVVPAADPPALPLPLEKLLRLAYNEYARCQSDQEHYI